MRTLLLLLALGAATPALAGTWEPAPGNSADMPFSGLALVGSTGFETGDGGMRLVTLWGPAAAATAPDGSTPTPLGVTRCVTDLGPDLAVVQDRCWQSTP